ncbi:MAG: sigma-54 dependent transcriptional regulator [Candidatus Latescibacteria bacterium]|jgi:DNA-binding NtrC family response regulator|nr:sigma-54 dependent transcriptional regulator [Candidatus Latescibacterota bacterium]
MSPTDPSAQEADRLLGESPAIQAVIDLVDRVADTTATVLITGESGTGKEVVARDLHRLGRRSKQAFVPVNCAAIPSNLLESELFGYEKGAFTDATISKKGLFEVAEGGTVFLDEIGLMPVDLQSKLLSVLDRRTFRRLGGTRDIRVDVRFIVATNEDLSAAVAEGRFREDLFFRLNVVPLPVPPLRERGDDILRFARHFLDIFAKRYKDKTPRLSRGAERWLESHLWPGNVRELRNVVERAVLLSPGEIIRVEDLVLGREEQGLLAREQGPAVEVSGLGEIRIALPPWGIALEDVERRLIEAALDLAQGNVTRAAQLLHVSRDTLRYRVGKHGLQDRADPGRPEID